MSFSVFTTKGYTFSLFQGAYREGDGVHNECEGKVDGRGEEALPVGDEDGADEDDALMRCAQRHGDRCVTRIIRYRRRTQIWADLAQARVFFWRAHSGFICKTLYTDGPGHRRTDGPMPDIMGETELGAPAFCDINASPIICGFRAGTRWDRTVHRSSMLLAALNILINRSSNVWYPFVSLVVPFAAE